MGYYVYILLDDRYPGKYDNYLSGINYKPFYVGKGLYGNKNKSERHLIHYNLINKDCNETPNPNKCRIIKKLINDGYKPNFKIVYENNDEKEVFEVEKKLIDFYGKKLNNGILTNISDGGVGGDTFTNNPNKEEIRKKHSIHSIGVKNPMYGICLEKSPSHISKLTGHWNKGKIMTDETKNKLKKIRQEKLPIIEMLDVNNGKILDKLTTVSAIKKYQLNPSCLYRCLNNGGVHKGYHWKYDGVDLVISKSLRETYVKPKRENIKRKKIYFKYDINDEVEYEYCDVNEASKHHNSCVEVIRRKCVKNKKTTNIFRYEDSEYKFELTGNGKKSIIRVDYDGNKTIYESITEAAKSIENGNPSVIVSVCKGKRKTHKGYKFEYVK